MLRKLGIFLLLLLVVGGIAYFIVRPKPAPDNGIPREQAVNGGEREKNAGNSPAGVDLLLKTMEITQGEKGLRLWRLETTWANMDKEDGLITVQKPRLVYYMPPDNKELVVTSEHGDVDQTAGILRFVSNVNATFEGRTVTGNLLVYNGTSRSMTFPDGGRFTGAGMQGSADKVVWQMGKNEIEAESNVHVIFESGRSPGE